MLASARQEFVVELLSVDGGLSLLPSPPGMPKPHRFQGGLIYSRMLNAEGRLVSPEPLAGRRIRLWVSPLGRQPLWRRRTPEIGYISDRAGDLPGGGLEAGIRIPEDDWLTSLQCLTTIWRSLRLAGIDGDGRQMRLAEYAFSSIAVDAFESTDRGSARQPEI